MFLKFGSGTLIIFIYLTKTTSDKYKLIQFFIVGMKWQRCVKWTCQIMSMIKHSMLVNLMKEVYKSQL